MTVDIAVQTLVDALADALRQQVLTGKLSAGSRVTEQEVASTYGVARPTAKAAIERVVQTGILRRTANKTAKVPLLSEDDIEDLYRSRIFFERNAVTALARLAAVPAEAEHSLESMRRALDSESFVDMIASDIGFHSALVSGLGSPRISRMYETIVGEAHLCMAQEQSRGELGREENYEEHRAIIESIRARDAKHAEKLAVDHLTSAASRVLGRSFRLY
jgi:DNA-binding GntR family transcriptional regulator